MKRQEQRNRKRDDDDDGGNGGGGGYKKQKRDDKSPSKNSAKKSTSTTKNQTGGSRRSRRRGDVVTETMTMGNQGGLPQNLKSHLQQDVPNSQVGDKRTFGAIDTSQQSVEPTTASSSPLKLQKLNKEQVEGKEEIKLLKLNQAEQTFNPSELNQNQDQTKSLEIEDVQDENDSQDQESYDKDSSELPAEIAPANENSDLIKYYEWIARNYCQRVCFFLRKVLIKQNAEKAT